MQDCVQNVALEDRAKQSRGEKAPSSPLDVGLVTKSPPLDLCPSRTHPYPGVRLIVLAVEGTIGCGKSTLLVGLRRLLGTSVLYVDEPVELWRETGLLDKMYKGDISALDFQLVALVTRFAALEPLLREEGVSLIITERSMVSDREVFAKATLPGSMRKSDLDNTAWMAYDLAHSQLTRVVPDDVLVVHVFLEAPRAAIRDRIEHRNRDEEKNIDVAYLDKLETLHAEWYKRLPAESRYKVDCTGTPDAVARDVEHIVHTLLGDLNSPNSVTAASH